MGRGRSGEPRALRLREVARHACDAHAGSAGDHAAGALRELQVGEARQGSAATCGSSGCGGGRASGKEEYSGRRQISSRERKRQNSTGERSRTTKNERSYRADAISNTTDAVVILILPYICHKFHISFVYLYLIFFIYHLRRPFYSYLTTLNCILVKVLSNWGQVGPPSKLVTASKLPYTASSVLVHKFSELITLFVSSILPRNS
ncbi:unnamed protein product [Acanthoscelides obtectus]|uniref:Uncharacterized protein n=1 Tax=Acanthoscelides obtectus TaxID=200917 RepID=A0A9P0NX81_ACAOB|nr:unnamed protein product [Acanthoscelides obtectus]CAK1661099.1 hypothetical protein AOBTE_LOCUS22438 [Acanthoscelides obtectus]